MEFFSSSLTGMQSEASGSAVKTISVLIIDDEPEIALLLSMIVKGVGYRVEIAHSLKEGEEKFLIINPELLLLDINLPDGSGLDYIGKFKALRTDLKIVMISAFDTHTDREKAMKFGADFFLSKPLNNKSITEVLKSLNK